MYRHIDSVATAEPIDRSEPHARRQTQHDYSVQRFHATGTHMVALFALALVAWMR